ncbi:metallophosphoesterase [Paenibacillus filicis]|uniref:Metallophosphoesterase n=1 Tax=Paenibacillus filicis TaxID=669464 RepID=A0ABU9DVQ2_9BACL
MIYITGDVHGSVSIGKRLNTRNFPQQKSLTKKDYVIIAGDFGLVWNNDKEDMYWRKWLNKEKSFTTLFIDGNHENHDLLDAYPVEEWNGGKVHKINESIIHLMRGQVYEIEGKKFFTFGGADSHDKEHRREGISWWRREMPSYAEYEEGLKNLDRHRWVVDYVITHTCCSGTMERISERLGIRYELDQMHRYFNDIDKKLKYKKWFFAHFHADIELPRNQRLIFTDVLQLT